MNKLILAFFLFSISWKVCAASLIDPALIPPSKSLSSKEIEIAAIGGARLMRWHIIEKAPNYFLAQKGAESYHAIIRVKHSDKGIDINYENSRALKYKIKKNGNVTIKKWYNTQIEELNQKYTTLLSLEKITPETFQLRSVLGNKVNLAGNEIGLIIDIMPIQVLEKRKYGVSNEVSSILLQSFDSVLNTFLGEYTTVVPMGSAAGMRLSENDKLVNADNPKETFQPVYNSGDHSLTIKRNYLEILDLSLENSKNYSRADNPIPISLSDTFKQSSPRYVLVIQGRVVEVSLESKIVSGLITGLASGILTGGAVAYAVMPNSKGDMVATLIDTKESTIIWSRKRILRSQIENFFLGVKDIIAGLKEDLVDVREKPLGPRQRVFLNEDTKYQLYLPYREGKMSREEVELKNAEWGNRYRERVNAIKQRKENNEISQVLYSVLLLQEEFESMGNYEAVINKP